MPDNESSLKMLIQAIDWFKNLGFKRYEISAFAKANKESLHNIGYWIGEDFIGFGPSAFSYLDKKRFQNICNLNLYFKMNNKKEKIRALSPPKGRLCFTTIKPKNL